MLDTSVILYDLESSLEYDAKMWLLRFKVWAVLNKIFLFVILIQAYNGNSEFFI